jgi:hypothetical protein
MLDAAKTLRAYAGILSAISSAPQQQTPAGPANPSRPKLPSNRIERTPSSQKRGQQIDRETLTV